MSSNNELKEFSFESCTFYYFDDIMRVVDINFDNILLDEKSYQNSYENTKIFQGEIPLHIRLNKVDGFIKTYHGTRYLVLFDSGWYDANSYLIRCLISKKSGTINSSNPIIRIDSYNSLFSNKESKFQPNVCIRCLDF